MNSIFRQSRRDERSPEATAPLRISLVCPGDNGPLPTEAFVRMLSRLVPNAIIVTQPEVGDAYLADGPAIILMKSPSAALGWRLTEGGDAPAAALAGWRDWAIGLLRSQRRNRKDVVLVDAAILDPDMSAARTLLTRRLGGNPAVSGNPVWASEEGLADETPDPLAYTVAAAMLEDRSVADLIAELESCTIGMGAPRDVLPRVLAAWQQHSNAAHQGELLAEHLGLRIKAQNEAAAERQAIELRLAKLRDEAERQKQAHKEELARLQEESALLRDNVALQIKMRNDLEQRANQLHSNAVHQCELLAKLRDEAERQKQAHKDELARLREESAHLRDNVAVQIKMRTDLDQRANQLQTRLDTVLGERAELAAARAAVERRRAYAQTHRANAQQRVDDLLASRSWRVTAPLRGIRRLLSR